MLWVYTFWALAAFALIAVVIDAFALKRRVAGKLPGSALVLKGLVIAAFTGVVIYINSVPAEGMEDLALIAGAVVLSVPVLLVTAVLDVLILRKLNVRAE